MTTPTGITLLSLAGGPSILPAIQHFNSGMRRKRIDHTLAISVVRFSDFNTNNKYFIRIIKLLS